MRMANIPFWPLLHSKRAVGTNPFLINRLPSRFCVPGGELACTGVLGRACRWFWAEGFLPILVCVSQAVHFPCKVQLYRLVNPGALNRFAVTVPLSGSVVGGDPVDEPFFESYGTPY